MSVNEVSEKYFINYVNSLDFCNFDMDQKVININSFRDNEIFFIKEIYDRLVSFLQKNSPPEGLLYFPKVKDIELGYYSGCLYNYIHEIRDLGKRHEDTCWFKNCENSVLLGYLDAQERINFSPLSYLETYNGKHKYWVKKNLSSFDLRCVHIVDGWVKYNHPKSFELFNPTWLNIRRYCRNAIKGKLDRSIMLLDTISREGFLEQNAYKAKNGVLGYSKNSKNFRVFHGKHRVAVTKYLVDKGKLPQDFRIKFPIVHYSFPHFGNASYAAKHCDCDIF